MDEQAARRLVTSQCHDLRRLVFDGLDLHSVAFHQPRWFDQCSFEATDLRLATIDRIGFKYCSFRGARLRGVSLRGASFAGCDLRGADLREADLTDARFGYVNTGRNDTGRTDLTGADLTGAVLRDTRIERVIGWPGDLPR